MPALLTVCTGNICRSPAAELLLRHELGDAVSVASAGTHGLVGHGIPEPMLIELDADGIDGSAHQAQLLTEPLIKDTGIVITMTREHRRLAVQTSPGALKRTFTLAELAASAGTGARLTGDTLEERLASLPSAIAAHRHVLAEFELSDVPDPYRRSQEAYHESYTMIRGAIREIGAWLRG